MTTLTLAYSAAQKKVRNDLNWKAICLSLLFLIGCLIIIYALFINQLTGGVYMIKKYQNQIYELSQETKTLEVNFAKTGFMGSVEQKARSLNFQRTSVIKYIQVMDAFLAGTK